MNVYLHSVRQFLSWVLLFCSPLLFAGDPDQNEDDNGDKDSTAQHDFSNLQHYKLHDLPYTARLDSLMMMEIFASDTASNGADSTLLTDYPQPADSVYRQRLEDLNRRSPLHYTYNETVRAFIDLYAERRREQVSRMLGLAHYYFPMFEQTLDQYDMPLEIKYLAIVESALQPQAHSRAGAQGMWQFMYATARMNGLRINSYIDERGDPLKATAAACRYLQKLHNIFGDWDLALAAYNSGPGNVSKAIRYAGGAKSYWAIRPFLPRETAGYVPAFIAASYVMKYASEHEIYPKNIKRSFFATDTVHVQKRISFQQVSELLDIPMEELQFLNPSYRHEVIPGIPENPYTLTLPKDKVGLFEFHEDSIYKIAAKHFQHSEDSSPQYAKKGEKHYHRVQRGEVLGSIAEKYGVGVSSLRRWNHLRGNIIHIGQRLTVYPRKMPSSSARKSASKSSTPNGDGPVVHRVSSGESFYSIARRFPGISAQNIMDWNNYQQARHLKPGDQIKIYPGRS